MKISIPLTKTVDDSYDIVIGPLPRLEYARKVAVVTNPKVAGLHLQTLLSKIQAPEVIVIVIPDGEEHKHLRTVEHITDRLFEHRFNRNSLLIALGGGVVGDMTGFAAAIFQRGIGFVQVPTTLLSMVDASVGGKTGCNNRFGKNLLGSFNQPEAVYADPSFLATLPKREFAAGVAEAVKMAVMFDKEFFAWLEKHDLKKPEHLEEAIRKSVELKAKVVAEDEKEKGVRAVLNYGHTFGHVIETQTNFSRYLHGECVAIGMMMANVTAVELGLMTPKEAGRVEALLGRYGLPLTYHVEDPEAFYAMFFHDKKASDHAITFIFPEGLGNYAMRDDVPEATVLRVLAQFDAVPEA